MVVHVGLKGIHDINGARHTYLNVLDLATRYSLFVRVEGKSSLTVSATFLESWISWAGPPSLVVTDQGGEFAKHFEGMAQRVGAAMRVIPAEAPWQNAMAERHGTVLGEIMTAMVDACHTEGDREMAMA